MSYIATLAGMPVVTCRSWKGETGQGFTSPRSKTLGTVGYS